MTVHLAADRDLSLIEVSIGFDFREKSLLLLALTHRSYINENPGAGAATESNERLEFLGDSVVGFAVGHHLYERAEGATEGELTAMRAQVVRREALAGAAGRLGLGEYLVMGKGEAAGGGSSRLSNLANVFEAIAGAILLDAGAGAASDFVLRALQPDLEAALSGGAAKDPKSLLQEALQARGQKSPEYVVSGTTGPGHDRMFVIDVLIGGAASGRGEGRRKIDAERAAARDALVRVASPGPAIDRDTASTP